MSDGMSDASAEGGIYREVGARDPEPISARVRDRFYVRAHREELAMIIVEVPKIRKTQKRTITVDAQLVLVLRKVAQAEGMRLGQLLESALRVYLVQEHPDWRIS